MENHFSKEELLRTIEDEGVEFIYLQFTDIFGVMKNVAITSEMFEKALDNEMVFDGSSIDGFVRIEESDMYLRPDMDTFCIYPWRGTYGREARLICDVFNPDGTPFEGDPRYILKRAIKKAEEIGLKLQVGPECEFFLFHTDENGKPTLNTHDQAGYFDLATVDLGENARKEMVMTLKQMGFVVEGSHHEVAPGQHEIDIKHDNALYAADRIMTLKNVVKMVAKNHGLYATFMPKPIYGVSGSGMHMNLYLYRGCEDALYNSKDENSISEEGYSFLSGILGHAKGMCAITNPTVNSYKRLVSGYEAPIHISWSQSNRSPLIRIPARKGSRMRFELRNPDLSCNPYLAIAAILSCGIDGIKRKMTPPAAIDRNIYELSCKEMEDSHIESLPKNLEEAIEYLNNDDVVKKALGNHICRRFIDAKRYEWDEYKNRITSWEIDNYLNKF